jgi:hypothetical protein
MILTIHKTKIIYRHYASFLGLPFKLNKKEALQKLIENLSWFERTPQYHLKTPKTNSPTIYNDNVFKEIFLPFHTAKFANIKSSFSGKYGIDRLESYIYYAYDPTLKMSVPRHGMRIVTDWYSISETTRYSCDYPLGTPKLQIYAGFEIRDFMLNL